MKQLRSVYLFLACLAVPFLAIAQPDPNLPSEEVEVLKTFKASLDNTDKLRPSPTLPAINTNTVKVLNYSIPTRLLTLEYEPPVIRPLAYPREKPQKVYSFFGKFGYGTPNSPYLDAQYFGGDKQFKYGVFAKHHSANRTALEHQRFSLTDLGIDGTAYLDNFAVNGGLGYTMDQVHFYGYDHATDTLVRDSVRQQFNDFHAHIKLFNPEQTRGDLNYNAGLDFYNRSDRYDAGETGIKATVGITKWFDRQHPLTVELVEDYSSYKATVARGNNNILALKPAFTYIGSGFEFTVGGAAGLEGVDSSQGFVFPRIEAAFNLVEDKAILIAGWTGDVERNSFRSLTDYNPFIESELMLRNTRYQKFYGGVKGTVSNLNYEFTAAYKPTTNLATYLNDTADAKRFNVVYNDFNVVTIHGGIGAQDLVPNLDLTASLDINTFNHTTSPDSIKAWHLPTVLVNAGAVYGLMDDKLKVKANVFVNGISPYIDDNGLIQNLPGLFDLGLGAEFQATDNINIFLDLNNLTNQQYQRWNGYPNFGFNVLGGLKVKF